MRMFEMKPNLNGNKSEKTDLKSVKKLLLFCKRYYPSIIIALTPSLSNVFTVKTKCSCGPPLSPS